MKFDFRSESFKRKFSKIIFFYKMMIGCFEKKKNYPKKAFELRNKEEWKFNLGVVLISLRITRPC